MSTTHVPDVIVVGGGMAGLAAAAYVARSGRAVTVVERRGRLGGQATTDEREGFLFNQGPHALYRGGPAESVLTELGVTIAGSPPPLKAALLIGDRIEIGPSGPWTLLRTGALGLRAKVELGRLLATLARVDSAKLATVSAADWIDDALRHERSRALAHALVRLATYVNAPQVLSADVAVSQLQSALSDGVIYVDRGWQSLVDQLAAHVEAHPSARIESGAAVTELPDAPAVIIAGGGPATAEALLGRRFELGPAAAASCLDLGLSKRPPHDFALGVDTAFYFSNHSMAADLAPDGSFCASAVQYLADGDEPDEAMRSNRLELIGVDPESVVAERRLHRMTTVTAIPTAANGGLPGRPGVADTGCDGVFLAGDWVGSTGHLLDASLASAREAAQQAVRFLDRRSRLVGA